MNMERKAKSKTKKTSRRDAASIVTAIGLSRILTAYSEANRPLPEAILGEFRVAVGLSARPLKGISRLSRKRFEQMHKTPFDERHKLFYNFWDEYFDFKLETVELYDESPEWLQAIADEVFAEIDADL